MVVIRIFLISILGFLLFNMPVYGLMPSSTDEIDAFSEEEASQEVDMQIEETKKEKLNLINNISSFREGRKKTLHPFVYNEASSEIMAMPPQRAVKGFIPPQSDSETTRAGSSGQAFYSKPALNHIFFSLIALAFFAAYFYIRPKP